MILATATALLIVAGAAALRARRAAKASSQRGDLVLPSSGNVQGNATANGAEQAHLIMSGSDPDMRREPADRTMVGVSEMEPGLSCGQVDQGVLEYGKLVRFAMNECGRRPSELVPDPLRSAVLDDLPMQVIKSLEALSNAEKPEAIARLVDVAMIDATVAIAVQLDAIAYPEYVGYYDIPTGFDPNDPRPAQFIQTHIDAETGEEILLLLDGVYGKWRARRIDVEEGSPLLIYAPGLASLSMQAAALLCAQGPLWDAVE